ncbi:hypothetical protein [Amycolatopsis eburnea]|uniref:ESX-1 secretion-associated protein n=1 Tax=Amycolatopsis eburnea TaxID=2267691 RepID=A0A3R9DC76_9PSEU|nr:hypothetical protein [Amycolatopsis eburnea]RSD09206.1 hypothetical protein EIY87_39800 [Amycolatopsis eburnea]
MTGYTVNIETIMNMAKKCYLIADAYADVTGKIGSVDAAVGHLTDRDGAATAADTDVIALVDEFVEYLRTASSRYHLAAEQLEAGAAAYTNTEDDQRQIFEDYAAAFDGGGTRDYGNADWDPETEADDTARPEGTTEHAEGFDTAAEGN